MLEYALASEGPSMALLVDHDDADREYAYEPEAVTVDFDGSFTAFARDSGWTVASMRPDWDRSFPRLMWSPWLKTTTAPRPTNRRT